MQEMVEKFNATMNKNKSQSSKVSKISKSNATPAVSSKNFTLSSKDLKSKGHGKKSQGDRKVVEKSRI